MDYKFCTGVICIYMLACLGCYLVIKEKNKYKTYFTPTILFTIPVILVSILAIFCINVINIIPADEIHLKTIFFIVSGCLTFYLISLFNKPLKRKAKLSLERNFFFINNSSLIKILISITMICFVFKFKEIVDGGIFLFGKDEFAEEYNSGFIAHLLQLSILSIPYIIYKTNAKSTSFKLKIFYWFYLSLIVIFYVICRIKYKIFFILFLIFLTKHILLKKEFNLRVLIQILIFICALFFAIYLIDFFIKDIKNVDPDFLYYHLFNYITGSIICLNYIINDGIIIGNIAGLGTLFPGVANFFIFASGSKNFYESINPYFINIFSLEYSNVYSFWGDIVIRTNLIMAIILTLAISIYSYLLMHFSSKYNYYFLTVLNLINMAILMLSFFAFWHGLLIFLELNIISILFLIFEIGFCRFSKNYKQSSY